MTRLDDPFIQKQRRTITAYRQEAARLKEINADLLEALKGRLFILGALRSVILSGETWTQEIEAAYVQAAEETRAAISRAEGTPDTGADHG